MRSTQDVGGRSLDDAQQFWYSVESIIKTAFPPNGIPAAIVAELSLIQTQVDNLMRDGAVFLESLPPEVEA